MQKTNHTEYNEHNKNTNNMPRAVGWNAIIMHWNKNNTAMRIIIIIMIIITIIIITIPNKY
jgi:hypothetical protein